MGVLQTWIYFAGRPTDRPSTKITVSGILMYCVLPQTEQLQIIVILYITTKSLQLQL